MCDQCDKLAIALQFCRDKAAALEDKFKNFEDVVCDISAIKNMADNHFTTYLHSLRKANNG